MLVSAGRRVCRRAAEEDGAVMVEYGLVLIGIAVVAFVGVSALGGRVDDLFAQALAFFP